jgi:hypothetical protein
MIAARAGVIFFFLLASTVVGGSLRRSEAAESWQAEWEKTVKAAEAEGQVSLYVAGYGKVIDSGEFQKAYPKIKVVSVTGSGTQLSNRIAAERRADKFLADVYNGGGNSLYQVLCLNKILDPIKPALLLPEVLDTAKWWESKHKYAARPSRQSSSAAARRSASPAVTATSHPLPGLSKLSDPSPR